MGAPENVLHLPMPKTSRVIKVASSIIDNPSVSIYIRRIGSVANCVHRYNIPKISYH